MATELGSAFISVGLGTNTLAGDIKKAFGGAESSGADAGKSAGRGFGGAFGVAAAAVGALGIGSFFKDAIGGAADLEQSVGAISTVFKGSASQMNSWAQSAATDVGLSANEFNELGTLIGSQLKNGGTAMDELAPKTQSLITLGSDLSSMFGGSTTEAVEALSSALKGERDPIERYGVSLSQAKIDAEAAALGFEKVDGALSAEASQAATLSLIMKQTADAHGNFGRETDTLAHKQQVLNAQLANGKARIGTELLPVAAAFTGLLSKALGPAIDGTVTGIKTVVGGFTAFGAAFKAADGDVTSNGFAGAMERIAFAARKVVDIGKTLWAGFKMPKEVADSFGANLNPLLAFGQTVRGIFDKVTFTAKTLWAGFKMPPEVVASIGANINPLLAFGAKVREAVTTVTNTAKALWAGFTMPPEMAASFGDKLNPILAIGVKLREFFDGVGSSIGPLVAQIIPLAAAFSPMQIIFAAIQPLLPHLGAMFMRLASVLGGSLLNILTALTPMFVQLSGVVSEALGGVIAAVLPTVITMITMLGATIGQLLPIITPIIATLIELATTLIGQLMPIITNLVASILPPLVDIFGNILSAIGPVITMVAGMLIPIIQALMPVVVTVFGVVADVIKNAMQIVQGIIQVVTGIISGDWSRVWQGIGNIFGGIWNTIVAVVRGALQIIGQTVISGISAAASFVGSALGSINRFFADTWARVIGGVAGFIANFMGYINGLPGKIMGALAGAGSWLVGVGRNIIQGLIDGARGMIDQAVAAVKNVGGAMLDGIKGFLGIKSPSRVFKYQVGQMIGEGLIAGVDSTKKAVTSSVNSLVNVPRVLGISAGSYTAASFGGRATAGGFANYGTIHVRDENEMARIVLNKQMNAQAAYGF